MKSLEEGMSEAEERQRAKEEYREQRKREDLAEIEREEEK